MKGREEYGGTKREGGKEGGGGGEKAYPWVEGSFKDGEVVSDEELATLQMSIKDFVDSLCLVCVSLYCSWDLLRVEVREPVHLSLRGSR